VKLQIIRTRKGDCLDFKTARPAGGHGKEWLQLFENRYAIFKKLRKIIIDIEGKTGL
jgi:hypothetical protein